MNKSIKTLLALGIATAPILPAHAEDDPNAAITAETARLTAEAARINAEAALTTARAAKEKGAIEALGLPKFENKKELGEKGGEIEAAMLATRAVSAAASLIRDRLPPCGSDGSGKVVVLTGTQTFDLNTGKVVIARMTYLERLFAAATPKQPAVPPKGSKFFEAAFIPGAIGPLLSAVAGLIGSDVKITGVDLSEVNDQMLATATAGQLTSCAILPGAQGGIADIEGSTVALKLAALVPLRLAAADRLAKFPEKQSAVQKGQAAKLQAAIDEYDAFYKELSTPAADGTTPFIKAILAESLAGQSGLRLLRITVNRAGGSMTNSKNIGTFFGADPIRVSGGLVATYTLVNAADNTVVKAGSLACQTARVRINDVQNGSWKTVDDKQLQLTGTAFCH